MGQTISDVFYPDNPKRRDRADQLKHDIEAFAKTYDEIKAQRDKILEEIKPQLAELLKNAGYDTPEKLDEKVRSVLKGDNLEKYLQVKSSHDKSSELEKTVFAISSYISIGSGVFLGGLALLGVITGGTAFALLGVVGGLLAAVAVAMIILAAFEGANERRDLREAIHKLGPERVKIRRALEVMQAISDWVVYIKGYLNSAAVRRNPDMKAEIWEGDFKADFEKSSHAAVVQWLRNFDRERGAWTDEDGDWASESSYYASETVVGFMSFDGSGLGPGTSSSVQELGTEKFATGSLESPLVVLKKATEHKTIQFKILHCAAEMCIGIDNKGEKWALMPETIAPTIDKASLDIKNWVFSIQKLADHTILNDMVVVDFTPVF